MAKFNWVKAKSQTLEKVEFLDKLNAKKIAKRKKQNKFKYGTDIALKKKKLGNELKRASKPASYKQREFMKSLGIVFDDAITNLKASDLINAKLNESCSGEW